MFSSASTLLASPLQHQPSTPSPFTPPKKSKYNRTHANKLRLWLTFATELSKISNDEVWQLSSMYEYVQTTSRQLKYLSSPMEIDYQEFDKLTQEYFSQLRQFTEGLIAAVPHLFQYSTLHQDREAHGHQNVILISYKQLAASKITALAERLLHTMSYYFHSIFHEYNDTFFFNSGEKKVKIIVPAIQQAQEKFVNMFEGDDHEMGEGVESDEEEEEDDDIEDKVNRPLFHLSSPIRKSPPKPSSSIMLKQRKFALRGIIQFISSVFGGFSRAVFSVISFFFKSVKFVFFFGWARWLAGKLFSKKQKPIIENMAVVFDTVTNQVQASPTKKIAQDEEAMEKEIAKRKQHIKTSLISIAQIIQHHLLALETINVLFVELNDQQLCIDFPIGSLTPSKRRARREETELSVLVRCVEDRTQSLMEHLNTLSDEYNSLLSYE